MPARPLLQRQAGLGSIEGLDLALLVEREHDGVGRRVDVEPDHVLELGDELRVGGQLELPHPVRLETVGAPDALHRADRDADRLRHHGRGPVGRLGGRISQRQGDDPLCHRGPERRNPRGSRLVAQQAFEAFLGEAFLPAPHAGLRLAGAPHDLVRAGPLSAEQHDLCPPSMLLSGVAIPDERLQTAAVARGQAEGNTRTHQPDSHTPSPAGIPYGIQMSDFIH